MAAVVGFAFLVTVATPVGKRISLLVITTITNAMRCMATTAGMVKKSGRWPFKKSAVGGIKTTAYSGSSKRAMKNRCYISTRNKLITFCIFLCEYIENIEAHVTHFLLAEWARDYRKMHRRWEKSQHLFAGVSAN